jgi:Sulfotransferase domain
VSGIPAQRSSSPVPALADRRSEGSGRLPNLIVVGVSRAGTTSLFNYLRQHPDVGTSEVKELRYFTALRHGHPLEPIESYAAHFKGCTQRYAMEATPGYFYGGGSLASVMRATCPSVRALVSLRNPVDRCWSWFRFVKSRDRLPQDMDFSDYLDRCEQLRREGTDGTVEHQPYWGLSGGCYADWLDGWVGELGDRFRVSFFEDMEAEPAKAVQDHCDWLGIGCDVVDDFELSGTNKSQLYKNRLLQRGAVVLNRHGERFFRRHPAVKRTLRSGYYAINRASTSPQMSQPERARLDEFYRPHNARLVGMLARLHVSVPSSWSSPT